MRRLLCLAGLAASLHAGEPSLFFRAAFDGSTAALALGKATSAVRETGVAYEAGVKSQAVAVREGTVIEHDLGAGFPAKSGALEVWFKPGFPQSPEQASRTVFALTGPDEARIDFGYHSQGTRWQFGIDFPGWRRPVAASNFDQEKPGWHHLVLVWDEHAKPAPVVRFYRDGRWDRGRTQAMRKDFAGLRRLVIGGEGDAQTSLDEIAIYDRVLSDSDVAFLYAAQAGDDRFAALARKVEADAQAAKAASNARAALVAKLRGRVAHIINPRGGVQRDLRLPEGIVATGLRVEDVGRVELSRFAVIYGPPGAGFQLTKEQDDIMRRYVQEGGGYVGVCAGANYAGKARLLNMKTHSLKNQGLVSVGVEKHPITERYRGEVVIHHGNGPVMIPGEGCHVVGSFLFGQNFPLTTAAIVAGENGRGRVAAFGPHPTGGGVEFESKGAHFPGAELGTERLLVNALLWAAKITD